MEIPVKKVLIDSLSYIDEMVMLVDRQGTILFTNARLQTVSGYSADELLGKTPKLFQSSHHDPAFYRNLWETIESGQSFSACFINARKDGALYYENKIITPIKNESGEITHFISIGRQVESLDQSGHARFIHYDQMTGLPNRLYFLEKVNEAIVHAKRRNGQLAVMLLDLDHFKNINDTLGHHIGDEVIRITAKRLSDAIRQGDVCARLGGDEFVILADDVNDPSMLSMMAREIVKKIMKPLKIDGNVLHIAASIGIAVYPDDGADCDALLKNADQAMYEAKLHTIRHFAFYRQEQGKRFERMKKLEQDIVSALESQEFEILYQPQIDVKTERCVSFEALLRWNHPTLGQIKANELIPVLENSGLARDVGEWTIKEVFGQLHRWHDEQNLKVHVSVNLSGHQLIQRDFVKNIKKIIQCKDGQLNQYFNIEITEAMLVGDMLLAMEKLQSLDELGVKVALDDFGSGFSSLSQLNHGPIKILKIDRKYISQLPDDKNSAALVDSIIAMAHSLGMKVTAVGVENKDQLDYLASKGCDLVQGFMFSGPVSANEIVVLL